MGQLALRREAFFLPASGGARFCLLTRPEGDARGTMIFCPPFAEELNKSRRMVALAASEFARHGWVVLQIDLLGCGDSAGDFGDASWDVWLDDLALGCEWLEGHFKTPPVLWSLRAGCLLASDLLARSRRQAAWLAWQPVTNGKQHLTQFLRLKAASEMLNENDAKSVMAGLRKSLQAGKTVEVAGYCLARAVTDGLESAAFALVDGFDRPVAIIEVAGADRQEVSPAIARLVEKWSGQTSKVHAQCVVGNAFWQTVEIEEVPALLPASLDALESFA